jgi:hypothetical protein
MKRVLLITVAIISLILLSPILFEKRTVPLMSHGRVVAVAKQPLALPWNDYKVDVYTGGSKVFSMWSDFFDSPEFIYPFAGGQRFLCDYWGDTENLVFIVDFSSSGTNALNSDKWPSDDFERGRMAKRITYLVTGTKGSVRLPSFAELQEASSNLVTLTSWQFRTASFPSGDFGIIRLYFSKADLLNDWRTNRQGAW